MDYLDLPLQSPWLEWSSVKLAQVSFVQILYYVCLTGCDTQTQYSVVDTLPAFQSEVLVNVSVESCTESELKVTCEFRADVTGQTECVVIWRRRTEQKLNLVGIRFPTTIFPIPIPIPQPGEYSVAVFGRIGGVIEQQPFLRKSLNVSSGII